MKSFYRLLLGIIGLAGLGGSLIFFAKYESSRDLEQLTTLTQPSDNSADKSAFKIVHEQK